MSISGTRRDIHRLPSLKKERIYNLRSAGPGSRLKKSQNAACSGPICTSATSVNPASTDWDTACTILSMSGPLGIFCATCSSLTF